MTTHVNINRHKDIAKAASTSASVGSFLFSDTTSICEVE